jgi:exodeoxyribonuclease VII large subunit
MTVVMQSVVLRRRSHFEQISGKLAALSPTAILERGYALVFDASGKLVKNSAEVRAGDEISARLAKGTIEAVVRKST